MSQNETQTNELILVVEDNSINQRVTLLQLEELGLHAHAVANGIEALDAVSSTRYSLILMDCQMPEMDGLQATKEIRQREEASGDHITIIALTAHAMTSDREACLSAGMDDYISKPVSLRKLAEVLQRWLKQPLNFDFATEATDSKNPEGIKPVELESLFSVFGKDLIEDLLTDFIAEADVQMSALKEAVSNKEQSTLKFLVHDLKGTSATIYATELTELSFTLETYCHNEDLDWEIINSYFDAIEAAWASVKEYLSENGYRPNQSSNLAS